MESSGENFKEQLHHMESRLFDLEEKIDMINTKVTQVVDAILGNPLTKVGGLMQDLESMKQNINDLQKKQVEYEDFKKRVYWTIGLILAGGIVLQYITNLYINLKK